MYDPVTQLLAWLEALAAGLPSCAFEFNDESQTIRVAAEDVPSEGMRLTIFSTHGPEDEGLPWRQMRSQAVEAWLALASSSKPYVFNHWQRWLKAH